MELHKDGGNKESRLRDRTSTREAQREKRKSEVLIAAQSLDNEVQNVKNLKRISIGSIDLLMDPELEYRVNMGGSSNINSANRNSWSSGSSSSIDIEDTNKASARGQKGGKDLDTESIEGDDTFEDSFDVTSSEYLNQKNDDSVNVEKDSQNHEESKTAHTAMNRNLSGVGSLRRGAYNVPNRRPSLNSSSNTTNSSASKPQNLLWVPADQHPNVKPENYLELVQDTLHNIKLEDSSVCSKDDSNNKENFDVTDTFPPDFSKTHSSLVRRPSRLRKSYTEFEESDEDIARSNSYEIEPLKHRPRSSTDPSRPITLKDITEELTKISNNAGLTDSDAVTLARTLSMSGSFTDEESSNKSMLTSEYSPDGAKASGSDDDEYASNMFMKHGFVIPARSSLRRSKFNTYRKRNSLVKDVETATISTTKHLNNNSKSRTSSEAVSMDKLAPNIEISGTNEDIIPLDEVADKTAVMTSPSTINDFQDLYDHYRQPSIGSDKIIDQEEEKDLKEDASSSESPQGIHVNPTQKRNGWSWLNGIGEKQKGSDNEESDEHGFRDGPAITDDDFIKTTKHTVKESERLATMGSNHSKNRHQPLFTQNNSKAPKDETADSAQDEATEEGSSTLQFTSTTSDKRQRLELKFVSLFKRKNKSKSKSANGNRKKHVHIEPNKKSSTESNLDKQRKAVDDGLPTFSRNMKTGSKIKSESQFENRLRCSSQNETLNRESTEVATQELPALQPAVSVTSMKSNQSLNDAFAEACADAVTESVRELDGDDSQDISVEQSFNLSAESSTANETYNYQKGSSNENKDESVAPTLSVLPPRKLRFEDVKRPDKPNAPIQFTDSAFGFPLPMLTVSTVIMFDHRLPVSVERAIYRLSHLKLSDPKRELRQQVLLSNFMYAYLNLVNHTLYMEQAAQDQNIMSLEQEGISGNTNSGSYTTEHNSADGAICIPDI